MFIHPHHGSAPPSQGHRIGFFRKLICDHLFAMTYSQRKNSAQPPLAVLKFSSPWGDAGAHESFVFFELVLVSGFGFERAKSPRPAVAPQIGFVLANWVRTCEKPASSRGRANWVRLFELVVVSGQLASNGSNVQKSSRPAVAAQIGFVFSNWFSCPRMGSSEN